MLQCTHGHSFDVGETSTDIYKQDRENDYQIYGDEMTVSDHGVCSESSADGVTASIDDI
jgi:hypothetical protein